jgi:hypothetical protein
MSDDLVIPNIAVAPSPVVHDMANDITEKVKADMLNLAQTLHCGGCVNTLNFGGDMKAYPVKGRVYPDGEPAYGILCEDCQQFENKVEEGPLIAIRFEGEDETPKEYGASNLPLEEQAEELAIATGGVPVTRGAKGKLTKNPNQSNESNLSMPEKEAKHGSRREK